MTTESKSLDLQYTLEDHLFRSQDAYAAAKYRITDQWLAERLVPGTVLANVGCGAGEYNTWVRRRGVTVVACEPDASAFAVAAAAADPRCLVANSSLLEFRANTAPVDLLVMHDVLEHIEDEAGAVRAVGALVKTGGEAVISVPALQSLFGYHDEQLGHYRRYTLSRLKDLFATDFEIVHARYFGSLFIPITLWFSKIRRTAYPKVEAGAEKKSLSGQLMSMLCEIQRRVPEPIGTSALVHLRRK